MVSVPGFRPIDPTSAAFLLAENRSQPMHVGGLQLFEPPADAGPGYVREMFESMRDTEAIAPLFRKHPHRSVKTGGTLVWRDDEQFDIEHHVRHSALPQPGRVRELLELVGRLHSTRLAWERPLWETHVIEGLADGRVAMYTKLHHSLVDGISAMRLMASVLSSDADRRGMPAPFAEGAARRRRTEEPAPDSLPAVAVDAATTAARTLASALEADCAETWRAVVGSTDVAAIPLTRLAPFVVPAGPGLYFARLRPVNQCGRGTPSNEISVRVH